MPITMTWNPQPGSWGDVTTLAGFFHHVRRGDYGTFRLFSTNEANEDLWTRLHLYVTDLSHREIPFHLAIPVAVLGLMLSLQRRHGSIPLPQSANTNCGSGGGEYAVVGRVLLFTYAFYMIVFHSLANLPLSEGLTYGVHMRFWQQPNVVVFIWFGIGLDQALQTATALLSTARAPGSTTATAARVHRVGSTIVPSMLHLLCLGLVGVQLATWYKLCDQSHAFYIRDYAQALLDPLPKHAILIVNFDLQWTSLRYLQRCEQRRPDVTVLNLSMMTFKWFASKHEHYPSLAFPGTRLVPYGSVVRICRFLLCDRCAFAINAALWGNNVQSDGFTFASFLDANYHPLSSSAATNGHRRGIFFGGKLNYQDQDFHAKYTFTPYGILDEIHRKQDTTAAQLKLKRWYASQQRVMHMVHARLPALPPGDLYNDETWEWTIVSCCGLFALLYRRWCTDTQRLSTPCRLAIMA